MKNRKNLSKKLKRISGKILESMYLVRILDGIIEGDGKEATLIEIIKKNMKKAFSENEKCRKTVSVRKNPKQRAE